MKLVNSSDYESYYNSVKGSIWKYLLDMDVPVTLIEKMFSVPSTDLYFLSQNDITLLSQHPAYEEWLAAQCPNALSRDERRDWLIDYNAFIADRPSPLGNGYARYLRDRERADSDCSTIYAGTSSPGRWKITSTTGCPADGITPRTISSSDDPPHRTEYVGMKDALHSVFSASVTDTSLSCEL